MQIESNEIQLISADLDLFASKENVYFSLLSNDERERANRLQLPIHKQRFIIGRGLLRTMLGLYLHTEPQDIIFSYEDKKKPCLQMPFPTHIQFNLSHSQQLAVYAFTLNHAIGVDVEKTRDDYHPGVAQRFFSPEENAALLSLPVHERPTLFYRIWARKEALAKAVGQGIFMHLSSISVPLNDDFAEIMIDNDKSWSLFPLTIHPAYQSAVATNQRVKKMTYWKWIDQAPVFDKTETF